MNKNLFWSGWLVLLLAPTFLVASEPEWNKTDGKPWQGPKEVTVYHSPTCNCCTGWIKHMQASGFKVTSIKTSDVQAIKQKYHLPPEMGSCHTALINGYVIEGHVPAADVKKLLRDKPKGVKGLAAPGMPTGSPGMEDGDHKEPFSIMSFDGSGKSAVYHRYEKY